MNDSPLVSVIMPSYNVGPYIRQCIESVSGQTLKDIEIICVDSGSTDGTLAVLEEYLQKDKRITLLRSDMKSYGHQMNLGLQAARGEYIGIVETDDLVSAKMFEVLYGLTDQGCIDIVKGNYWEYYSDDTAKKTIVNTTRNSIKDGAVFTLKENPDIMVSHPSIWSAIYRRAFLEENHIRFMEEPGAGWVDNPFYFETLCAADSIRWTSIPCYYYRMTNPDSSTNNIADPELPIRRMMDNLDVIEKYDIQDEKILAHVYAYAVYYALITMQREDFSAIKEKLRPQMRKMMKRLDKQVVLDHLRPDEQLTYYEAISPLPLNNETGDPFFLGPDDIGIINEENEFLRKKIEKGLRLQAELDALKDSRSWKVGNLLMRFPAKIKHLIGI